MNYINQHEFYLETDGKIIDVDGVYGGQCFTKGHYITMNDKTYKKIEDINVGDYVYNKNMKRRNKVLSVISRKANVIKLNTATNNFICTKDHLFYNGEKFIFANWLNKNDCLYFPKKYIRKKYRLTKDELIWLGYWLGDGNIIESKNEIEYTLTISRNKEFLINSLSVKTTRCKGILYGKGIVEKLRSESHPNLYNVLGMCHDKEIKRLPQIFTKRQYMYIIGGYFKSDGYRNTVTSTSLELLLGIQYGLRINKIKSSVRIKRKAKVTKNSKAKDIYILTIIREERYFQKKDYGSAVVYNLMVDGDNTYICNNIAVHNCWDLFAYFCQKYCGKTFPCIETGYVIDLWNTFDIIGLNKYFIKVNNNFQDGDWLIYKAPSSITTSSHIAMFRIDNKDNTSVILTQNPNNNPNYTHQMVCDYSGLVGALRPKIYVKQASILAPDPVERNMDVDQVYVNTSNSIYCRTNADNTIENKVDDYFVKEGYYNIISETDFNNYHWYQIANNRWIAHEDDYVELLRKKEKTEGIIGSDKIVNNVIKNFFNGIILLIKNIINKLFRR